MSITNAVLTSGTPFTDLTAREVLATEYLMLQSDSDISILNHPALLHATGQTATGIVVRVPHIGLGGYDKLSATTPGAELAAIAMASGHTDVTLASRAKRYAADDLARYLVGQAFNVSLLAQDCLVAAGRTLINLIANVTDDFTTTQGTTLVALSWDDISTGKAKLKIAGAHGQILCVLHPYQWAQLEKDAASLGIAVGMSLVGLVNAGLNSYVGTYMGVDFYTSIEVPTANAGADRAGAMFVRGGVAWADAMAVPEPQDFNIIDLGRARLERVRMGEFLATNWVMSYHCGVAKAIDGAGVTLVSVNA